VNLQVDIASCHIAYVCALCECITWFENITCKWIHKKHSIT